MYHLPDGSSSKRGLHGCVGVLRDAGCFPDVPHGEDFLQHQCELSLNDLLCTGDDTLECFPVSFSAAEDSLWGAVWEDALNGARVTRNSCCISVISQCPLKNARSSLVL